MNVCGLKLTHDSSISVVSDGRLVFSVELEKVNNNPRYYILEDLSLITSILGNHGYTIDEIDLFVIDGWVGKEGGSILTRNLDADLVVPVARYEESGLNVNMMDEFVTGTLRLGQEEVFYMSFSHVLGHIMASYCTSPFSVKREDSYVLVWDGGMYPKLYYVDAVSGTVNPLGAIFNFGVNIYSIFAQHFRPFKYNANVIKDELSIAGKVMAYAAYGEVRSDIIVFLEQTLTATQANLGETVTIPDYPYAFTRHFLSLTRGMNFFDEDVIASFHHFIGDLLIKSLREKIEETGSLCGNLCLSGGAFLNIKWNSTIRSAGLVRNQWICPFPNDSGSSIGAACSGYFHKHGLGSLEWNVYSGPLVVHSDPVTGWKKENCTVRELARLLHTTMEPIVLLNDRAELGPRALGNRSIIACCNCPSIKDVLNLVKLREPYRPIAPICLEEYASEIFSPGGADPYMLYEHTVKPEWRKTIPGICHHDNSARLQTISEQGNPLLYELLSEYHAISGIPVLCNTSANFKGSGFFPDVYSASKWGKVNYIWCEGVLYSKSIDYQIA